MGKKLTRCFGVLWLAAGIFPGGSPLAAQPAPAASTGTASVPAKAQRPARWAQRLERPGLPNFFKVSDDLYRGAQPTAEGLKRLAEFKVKTVVNLRTGASDRKALAGTGMEPVELPMDAWRPNEADVVAFLRAAADPQRTPVFVHCRHGADRTGMMVAVYRVVVQGWPKEEAVREMTTGGFGYHSVWKRIVKYVRGLDADALRRKAGLPAPASPGGKSE